jgi:glycerate-2-kinase
MTPVERVSQIMLEERRRTMIEIGALDATEAQKQEVVAVVIAVQEAINKHLAARESSLDARIIPAALAGMAQELGRVYKRLAEEGLSPGSPQQNGGAQNGAELNGGE